MDISLQLRSAALILFVMIVQSNDLNCFANSLTDLKGTSNSSYLAPALFVIGDSSVDSGNNNYLGTFARADRPPYGRDFDTHRPTGRFCNGRIPVDYLGTFYFRSLQPLYVLIYYIGRQVSSWYWSFYCKKIISDTNFCNKCARIRGLFCL